MNPAEHPDCWTCRASIGADETSAKVFRVHGYSLGTGALKDGMTLVCERFKQVAPTPCGEYEREAGSDDKLGEKA